VRLTFLATCSLLVPLSASLSLAEDVPETVDAKPLTEAAYRDATTKWNEIWTERPALTRRDEASCLTAWQTGDRVRAMVRAATPPPAHAAYHGALLKCIEASLAVSDECLLKPRGGPKWGPYFLAARKKCPEIARIVNREKLDLPRTW